MAKAAVELYFREEPSFEFAAPGHFRVVAALNRALSPGWWADLPAGSLFTMRKDGPGFC